MKNHPEILAIHSDKKELTKVETFLRELFVKEKLPEEVFNKVLLCVSEAVVNSIEHGNKNVREKKVTIGATCLQNDLRIKVTDEGEGFDYEDVASPVDRENIRKETGRGIFIMKSICSKLSFRDRGKCVEFKIELK